MGWPRAAALVVSTCCERRRVRRRLDAVAGQGSVRGRHASLAAAAGPAGHSPRTSYSSAHSVMVRRQLAVASPVSATAVARAFVQSIGSRQDISQRARSLVAETFQARGVALTDSGTSALVLALRLAIPA